MAKWWANHFHHDFFIGSDFLSRTCAEKMCSWHAPLHVIVVYRSFFLISVTTVDTPPSCYCCRPFLFSHLGDDSWHAPFTLLLSTVPFFSSRWRFPRSYQTDERPRRCYWFDCSVDASFQKSARVGLYFKVSPTRTESQKKNEASQFISLCFFVNLFTLEIEISTKKRKKERKKKRRRSYVARASTVGAVVDWFCFSFEIACLLNQRTRRRRRRTWMDVEWINWGFRSGRSSKRWLASCGLTSRGLIRNEGFKKWIEKESTCGGETETRQKKRTKKSSRYISLRQWWKKSGAPKKKQSEKKQKRMPLREARRQKKTFLRVGTFHVFSLFNQIMITFLLKWVAWLVLHRTAFIRSGIAPIDCATEKSGGK